MHVGQRQIMPLAPQPARFEYRGAKHSPQGEDEQRSDLHHEGSEYDLHALHHHTHLLITPKIARRVSMFLSATRNFIPGSGEKIHVLLLRPHLVFLLVDPPVVYQLAHKDDDEESLDHGKVHHGTVPPVDDLEQAAAPYTVAGRAADATIGRLWAGWLRTILLGSLGVVQLAHCAVENTGPPP